MASAKAKNTRWKKVRKLFNDIHLWLGLASGLIVIAICFSGTVYVFNTELRELASPHLYRLDSQSAEPLEAEKIIEGVVSSAEGSGATLRVYANPGRPWQVGVRKQSKDGGEQRNAGGEKKTEQSREKKEKSGEKEQRDGRGAKPAERQPSGRPNMPTMYAVNQYTGEILGNISDTRNGTIEFMSTMFSLHRWLLLDKIEEPLFGELPNRKLGSYISGTATILFTLGLLTGIVIWFPQKVKSWKQGLVVKLSGNWKRINHDLHNTMAFYSFIFLLLMGITGPQWSFEWYREYLQKSLGTFKPADSPRPEGPKSTVAVGDSTRHLKIADYLAVVDRELPYPGDYMITLPADVTAPVMISKYKVGFFAPVASDRVSLDQYSGEVLSREVFSDKPFNERIAGSIKAIHVGDVYGRFTKVLYFVACLIATTLPVTGTLIWINKLRKKRVRDTRKQPVALANA